MLKSILSIALAALITAGTPAANVDTMTAKKLNSYNAENGIRYTAFVTSDSNMWIAEGKYKKGKYVIVFDNQGTKAIEDDEIVKIIKYK